MDKAILQSLIGKGLSAREIGEQFNITQTPVRYWLKKHGLQTQWRGVEPGRKRGPRPKRVCQLTDDKVQSMQRHYDEGGTFRSLMKTFGVSNVTIRGLVKEGRLHLRTLTEAAQMATRLGRKHKPITETTRQRQRESALKRIARDPSSHPNRRVANNRKQMSFPERCVYDALKAASIPFQHNGAVDRFFIDFLFPTFGVEIDGAYWHDPIKDANRDELIRERGIEIIRFDARTAIKATATIVAIIQQRLSTGYGAR